MSETDGSASPPAKPSRQWKAPSGGHPLGATVICCVLVLVVESVKPPAAPEADTAAQLGFLLGTVAANVFFIWGLAWLITLRHASDAWRERSLVAVVLVAVIAAGSRIGWVS